jgi:hypothetical protein
VHFNGAAIVAIEIIEAAPHLTPKPFHIASRGLRLCRAGIPRIFSKERGSIYTHVRHLGMAGYTPTQIRKPSDETEFEKHCVVLFKDLLDDPNVKRLGRRGQKQDGVDIIGERNRDSKILVGIQCKLKSERTTLTDTEVKKEVAAAISYKPPLQEYFILTTAPDDTALDQLCQKLSLEQAQMGRTIHIAVWGWGTLSEKINQSESAKHAFDPGFSPAIAFHGQKLDVIIDKLDSLQGSPGWQSPESTVRRSTFPSDIRRLWRTES